MVGAEKHFDLSSIVSIVHALLLPSSAWPNKRQMLNTTYTGVATSLPCMYSLKHRCSTAPRRQSVRVKSTFPSFRLPSLQEIDV